MLNDAIESAKGLWDKTLERAATHKRTVYGRDADDNKRFYGKPQDFMYTAAYAGVEKGQEGPGGYLKSVRHRMSTNLVFNMVEVYLPALYARNPIRKVSQRRVDIPDDLLIWLDMARQAQFLQGMAAQAAAQGMPMPAPQIPPAPSHDVAIDSPQQKPVTPEDIQGQLRAKLVEWSLNQLSKLNDLKGESRPALVDGLICGRGILEVQMREADGVTLPGSFRLPENDLLVDPDVKNIRDAKWIAIRRLKPVYQVEAEWGHEPGSLEGNATSYESEATQAMESDQYDRVKMGGTCDLMEYWEVYSRMGMGAHLQGAHHDLPDWLDAIGDNVMLIVSHGSEYPLNLPKELFDPITNPMDPEELLAEVQARVEWPVPTWKRPKGNNPWPIAELDFHENPDESWPIAHCTPVMPLVKAINWVYSYMMGRVRIASRCFPVVQDTLDEETKQTILYGDDMELIELKISPGMRERLIEFITIPDVSKDLWTLVAAMIHEFEKATGVTEMQLTGQTPQQMRSAAEAQVKQQAMSVRPEDMANTVQDWMTRAAENEAFALIHSTEPQSIAQLFGESYDPGGEPISELDVDAETPPTMGKFTTLWQQLIASMDSSEVMNILEFDIESGSAQKKNREQQQTLAQQAMQMLFQPVFGYYMKSGDPTQLNALIRSWAIANDHPTPDQLMFPDMRQQIAMQQQMAMQQQAAQQQHGQEHGAPQQEQPPPEQAGPPAGPQLPPEIMQLMQSQFQA